MVADVHREICGALQEFEQDVIAGKSPRLMIFMPPRSGKSAIGSRCFPAWFLGRNPEKQFIATSYAQSLADTFSRQARALVLEDSTRPVPLFPLCQLDKDSASVQQWSTTRGGMYRSAGVGAGITGMGAHCLVIDDPVKDAMESRSQRSRDAVWEWYNSTAYTRLMPGAGVIVIQTRWNLDDLSGRLLAAQPDKWRVLKYPAIDADGLPLHAERYDLEYLEGVREQLGSFFWSALYQQNPIADENMPFKPDMFSIHDGSPDPRDHTLGFFADIAYTRKKSSDSCAMGLAGVDAVGVKRWFGTRIEKMDSEQSTDYLIGRARLYNETGLDVPFYVEANHSYITLLKQKAKQLGVAMLVIELKPKGESKPDRILATRIGLNIWEFDPGSQKLIGQFLGWSADLDGTVPDDGPDMHAYADVTLKWQEGQKTSFDPRPKPLAGGDAFQGVPRDLYDKKNRKSSKTPTKRNLIR